MIRSANYTIYSASATPIALGDSITADGMNVWLHNHDHQQTHDIYIGDASVSASTGMHIVSSGTIGPVGLAPGEVIYAISSEQNGVPLQVFATRT